ncbi:RNA polymerase subunit sigma [Bordetella genomosp. 5]|uniref:RNA polymerase subunit sigma n=1 Tax=Bordetella genomosp. 5 TaxID=1395608 RepID=A0A261TRV4_9BORD|nr:sigma-70 family RNA polymerase sigma factor [Bordetella genomosp. 5]OZI42436.1 RNA polymerase subunit sigma [Bordetella genomosp. 5]OZI52165.1 RNA polymerase subunit sigma [Bordetella genomosp. 5]
MTAPQTEFSVSAQLPALRAYARTLTRNPHDADDLVQEALARAYERRHTWRAEGNGNPRAWLMSILHNVFVSEWRRARNAAAHVESWSGEESESAAVAAPQEHHVRLQQIRRAFDQLPLDQREALHLVTLEGLSYQEAARVLDVPVGTLMSRLGRARAALREFEATGQTARRLRVVGGTDV